MKTVYAFLWAAVGGVLALAGDVALKKSNAVQIPLVLVGALLYGLAAMPAAVCLRMLKFADAFILWEAVFVISGMALASLLYHEPLTCRRMIAAILAISAIIAISK